MPGRNFYFDGDGDGIADDIGYAYFPDGEASSHHDDCYEYHNNHHNSTSSTGGISILRLLSNKKVLKGIFIAAGVLLGISTLTAVCGFIVFAIYHIVH